jgi:hypothetical protein
MQLPSHRTHKYADKICFGKPFPKVHEMIDLPYISYRKGHRRFFHTYKEAYCIGYIVSGEVKGGLSGALHVWLDEECSKDRNFKKWMNWAAKEDAKLSRQMAKQRRKIRQLRAKS